MHTVIAFDISDDRRRYRVVKLLKSAAMRVQHSVFESSRMLEARFLRLRSELEQHIDLATDRVRYHRLCAACARRAIQVGNAPVRLDAQEEFIVVTELDGPLEDDGRGRAR